MVTMMSKTNEPSKLLTDSELDAVSGGIIPGDIEHQNELLSEAWEHPGAKEWRQKERMKLARKAIVAEIRDKGGKVSSIDPQEIKRLIDAYLKDHPEENTFKTFVCFEE
jgi:hypothetical protein